MSNDNKRGHNASPKGFVTTPKKVPNAPTPQSPRVTPASVNTITSSKDKGFSTLPYEAQEVIWKKESDFRELDRNAHNTLVHIRRRFIVERQGKQIAEACSQEFANGDNYGLSGKPGYDVYIKTLARGEEIIEARIINWINQVNAIANEEESTTRHMGEPRQIRQTDEELRTLRLRDVNGHEDAALRESIARYAEEIYANSNGYYVDEID